MQQSHRDRIETIADDRLLLESLRAVFDDLIDYKDAVRKKVPMSNENLGAFMRAYNERELIKEEFFKVIESTKKVAKKPTESNPAR